MINDRQVGGRGGYPGQNQFFEGRSVQRVVQAAPAVHGLEMNSQHIPSRMTDAVQSRSYHHPPQPNSSEIGKGQHLSVKSMVGGQPVRGSYMTNSQSVLRHSASQSGVAPITNNAGGTSLHHQAANSAQHLHSQRPVQQPQQIAGSASGHSFHGLSAPQQMSNTSQVMQEPRVETLLQQKDERIGAAAIPRPVSQHERLTEPGGRRISASNFTGPPPSANSYVTYVEEVDSTPRYIRSSLGLIPQAKVTYETSKIPLGVMVCPFPALNHYERPPPAVDLSPFSPIFTKLQAPMWNDSCAINKAKRPGPVRCPKCGSYVCPFFVFALSTAGCCFCGEKFSLPTWYVSALEEHRRMVGSEAELRERITSMYDLKEALSILSNEWLRSEVVVGTVDYVTHLHPTAGAADSIATSWRTTTTRSNELTTAATQNSSLPGSGGTAASSNLAVEGIGKNPYKGAGYCPAMSVAGEESNSTATQRERDNWTSVDSSSSYLNPDLMHQLPLNFQCVVFAVDTSAVAKSVGFTESVFVSLKQCVKAWPNAYMDICIITFTDCVSVYTRDQKKSSHGSVPLRISVVSDVEEPFVPDPVESILLRVKCGTAIRTSEQQEEAQLVQDNNMKSTYGDALSVEEFETYVDSISTYEKSADETRSSSGPHHPTGTDNCAIAAVKLGMEIVKNRTSGPQRNFLTPLRGGSVVLFTTSFPTVGMACPKPTGDASNGSGSRAKGASKFIAGTTAGVQSAMSALTDGESNVYTPEPTVAVVLKKLVEDCVKNAICIQTFAASTGEVKSDTETKLQLGSLGFLSCQTGGTCRFYKGFSVDLEYEHLFYDIHRLYAVPFGSDCSFKIRVSKGIMVKAVLCPWSSLKSESGGFGRDATAFQLPRLSADTTIVFELGYTNEELPGNSVLIQIACAYTNAYGQRLLRVMNRQLLLSTSLSSIFRHAEIEATSILYTRRLLLGVMGGQSNKNEEVLKSLMELLLAYRLNSAASTPFGQLILPESLKLLPVYLTGLFKSMALRTNTNIDERVSCMLTLIGCPLAQMNRILYPIVYPLYRCHHQQRNEELQNMGLSSGVHNFYYVPPSIPASGRYITTDGIFLMDNGVNFYIYIGKDVDATVAAELVPALFNGNHYAANTNILSKGTFRLPPIPQQQQQQQSNNNNNSSDSLLVRIWNVVNQLRMEKIDCPFQPVKIIMAGSLAEETFIWQLKEDRLGSEKGYVDHLCDIHRQVQKELNADNG